MRPPVATSGIPVTTIRARDELTLAAPPARVFAVLADLARWERWWPWMVGVQPLALEPGGTGSVLLVDPFGAPTFHWRIEALEPPRRLRVRYERGPYAGTGEWRVDDAGAGSRVSYTVDLTTSHVLLQPLGRLLDLGGVHSLLMRSVLRGLEREVTRAGPP